MIQEKRKSYPFQLIWSWWCDGLSALYDGDEKAWWKRVETLFERPQYYEYDGVKYSVLLGQLESEIVIIPIEYSRKCHECYVDFVYANGPYAPHHACTDDGYDGFRIKR